MKDLGSAHRNRNFAIVIDEAHSSQGGKVSAALATALSRDGLIDSAGELHTVDGVVKHRAFHSYTMKQAIEEGFILDVLANYIPVQTYYKLVKIVEDDPEFDVKRATKKLRSYVEGQRQAIRQKAAIMADHFHEQVFAKVRIGGNARAMVVTSSIDRAIQYYEEISAYLAEMRRPYRVIVAFSDIERDGVKITEATYNGFPGAEIPDRIREDPYRILVVADKYQTGYA